MRHARGGEASVTFFFLYHFLFLAKTSGELDNTFFTFRFISPFYFLILLYVLVLCIYLFILLSNLIFILNLI